MSGVESGLTGVVECLLFVSGDPLSLRDLTRATEADAEQVLAAVAEARERYRRSGSALHIVEIAGGFQMATRPEYAAHVGRLLAPGQNRLSRPALETVTIVAYRQPCTQAEIEAIRGVSIDGVLKTLVERELIKENGRRPTPGRPLLYGTTDQFLHYFGLASLADLPPLEDDEAEETARAQAAETALVAAGVLRNEE